MIISSRKRCSPWQIRCREAERASVRMCGRRRLRKVGTIFSPRCTLHSKRPWKRNIGWSCFTKVGRLNLHILKALWLTAAKSSGYFRPSRKPRKAANKNCRPTIPNSSFLIPHCTAVDEDGYSSCAALCHKLMFWQSWHKCPSQAGTA